MVNQPSDLTEIIIEKPENVSEAVKETANEAISLEKTTAEPHDLEETLGAEQTNEISKKNMNQVEELLELPVVEAPKTSIMEVEEPILLPVVEAKNEEISVIEPTLLPAEVVQEPILPPIEAEKVEVLPSSEPIQHEEIETIQSTIEPIEEEEPHHDEAADYSSFGKKDYVELAEKLLVSVKKEGATASDFKNADNVLREIKPAFDELKATEKVEARRKFVEENGSDEGFQYKNDNYTVRFESLAVQIRDAKTSFFKKIEREREDNFETKTALLQKLREVVEADEAGQGKDNWKKFKQIQEDWKAAGNVNSPHNSSLWSAYSALVDRYFSIRHIQNELKDLDRKKNLVQKTEIVGKIENIAKSLEINNLSNTALKQANELLEEYKHIGPAQRDDQDKLWQRLKAAFDIIYAKRREQNQSASALQDEIFIAKSRLLENIKPYTEFESTSINEWNAKSKEIMAIQEQWNAIKGAMPKEKGKDLSQHFWAGLKTFFQRKGEFFKKLEAEREGNLQQKNALCQEVETFLAEKNSSPEATNRVIELQKVWRTIGHVPEKFKDKIFDRFKKACDAFFNAKRNKNNDIEAEYEENLKKKIALCEQIEKAAKAKPDLTQLPELKAEFNAIGYVPRKEMQAIQRRFVDAINAYVKASTGVSGVEKEKMFLQNEVEAVMKGEKGGGKNLDRKENDVRRKIKTLEDDIALLKNNIEFFARSKNAAALKADIETKIQSAENELVSLKQQLKIIVAAN